MMEKMRYDDMDILFLVLSGKVSLLVDRALVRGFRINNLEITPEQFTVLSCLWKKDGVTQQELCNITNKDKPSMTRLIHNLEKLNLVVRIADKSDGRNNLIYLTKSGKSIEQKALEIAVSTVQQALKGVSAEQIEICRLVLKNVEDNLL